MNKALRRTIPAIIFFGVALLAFDVNACSCAPRPSIYARYRFTPAVFVGKVTASRDVTTTESINDKQHAATRRLYQFSVTESFKGVKASQLWIDVGRIDSTCYTGFAVGESYLVFAYGDSEESLETAICSGTNELWDAAADLHYIRALLKGVPEARVYGSVTRQETMGERGPASPRATPVEGIKILIEGEGKRFEAVTDKQGLYRIDKIPDGRYKARPLLPDRYKAYFPAEEEFILGTPKEWVYLHIDPGPSAYINFRIGWNTELKGRVLDAEGNPVVRAKAVVLIRRGPSPVIIRRDTYDYRPEGKFEFGGLPPGSYFLAVDIQAPFPDKERPTRFYYPNTDTVDQAELIKIGESETVDGRDIRLPPEYLVREIEGVVVWPNGVPVSGAHLDLAATKEPANNEEIYEIARTDALGRFSLQAFVGAEYWVLAESGGSGKGEPIKIKVEKTNEPLKIVLPFPQR